MEHEQIKRDYYERGFKDAQRIERERLGTGIDFARRVEVEQRLLDAFTGKRPLPTREECRDLAHTLGIPDEYRERKCATCGDSGVVPSGDPEYPMARCHNCKTRSVTGEALIVAGDTLTELRELANMLPGYVNDYGVDILKRSAACIAELQHEIATGAHDSANYPRDENAANTSETK